MVPSYDELGIEHQVEAEEEGPEASVHHSDDLVGPHDCHEAEYQEDDQADEDEAAHHCEVIFGLLGEPDKLIESRKEREGEGKRGRQRAREREDVRENLSHFMNL